MDLLTLALFGSLAVLLASVIVNIYYACRHYNCTTDAAATQTNDMLTNNREAQVSPVTKSMKSNTDDIPKSESTVQTDLVYYVTLPEQLDKISEQLNTNRQDLTRCMQWIGECEQATLVTTQAVEQQ